MDRIKTLLDYNWTHCYLAFSFLLVYTFIVLLSAFLDIRYLKKYIAK